MFVVRKLSEQPKEHEVSFGLPPDHKSREKMWSFWIDPLHWLRKGLIYWQGELWCKRNWDC